MFAYFNTRRLEQNTYHAEVGRMGAAMTALHLCLLVVFSILSICFFVFCVTMSILPFALRHGWNWLVKEGWDL